MNTNLLILPRIISVVVTPEAERILLDRISKLQGEIHRCHEDLAILNMKKELGVLLNVQQQATTVQPVPVSAPVETVWKRKRVYKRYGKKLTKARLQIFKEVYYKNHDELDLHDIKSLVGRMGGTDGYRWCAGLSEYSILNMYRILATEKHEASLD